MMVKKTSLVIAGGLFMALSFIVLMHIKNDVQAMRAQQADLVDQRSHLQETLRVLNAEWAYQTRPARLAAFADALGLKTISANQVIDLSAPDAPAPSVAAYRVQAR